MLATAAGSYKPTHIGGNEDYLKWIDDEVKES
jgi:hypothetical protein